MIHIFLLINNKNVKPISIREFEFGSGASKRPVLPQGL
jgi:hypothetical protein